MTVNRVGNKTRSSGEFYCDMEHFISGNIYSQLAVFLMVLWGSYRSLFVLRDVTRYWAASLKLSCPGFSLSIMLVAFELTAYPRNRSFPCPYSAIVGSSLLFVPFSRLWQSWVTIFHFSIILSYHERESNKQISKLSWHYRIMFLWTWR